MNKVTIKQTVLTELLKKSITGVIIKEALKVGEINIVDDVLGKKTGTIPLKSANKQGA